MEYKYCCKILYNYYAKTHCSVNSLTENLNDFIDVVPKTIIYTKSKDKIKYCTFIEKKAIAYLASFNDTISKSFLDSLLGYMFSKYEYIFWGRWYGLSGNKLREKFNISSFITFDFYVKVN